MKKIPLFIIGLVIMAGLTASVPAYAKGEDCSKETPTCSDPQEECINTHADQWQCVRTLKSGTFNVQEVLNLYDEKGEKTNQQQKYFSDKEDPDTPAPRSAIIRLIIMLIEFATRVIGSIALILFIIAGIMMIISQGNQQRLDSAKDTFKYAVIGLLITFLSYTIVIFIQSLFTTGEPAGSESTQEQSGKNPA